MLLPFVPFSFSISSAVIVVSCAFLSFLVSFLFCGMTNSLWVFARTSGCLYGRSYFIAFDSSPAILHAIVR